MNRLLEEVRHLATYCNYTVYQTELGVGTYIERENGLSQLLRFLFPLMNSQLRALLHVTKLPLKEKYHQN